MPKIAYFDCPTGIAGDMCLGALLDVGVPRTYLETQLARLGLSQEYRLQVAAVNRHGQKATNVNVDLTFLPPTDNPTQASSHQPHPHVHHHDATGGHGVGHTHGAHAHAINASSQHAPHRHLPEIEQLIRGAELPAAVTEQSLAIFRKLAIAEGQVHGIPPEQVHFHEVGATDAIVDIVGTCLGLHWLGIEQVYCSALPTGGGTVKAAHGRLPVPVPAVLKLWAMRQVPVYHNGIDRELVTPTGAAIAVTLAQAFGPPPPMQLQQVGQGAGDLELPRPNLLRLWVGEPTEGSLVASPPLAGPELETVMVLETQIDDLNPQVIGYVYERLFAVGAVDVFTQAIGMKKSRPGILLTVICPPQAVDACEQVVFTETTTLGIRRSQQQRRTLRRAFETIETSYGPVRLKLAWQGEHLINVQPEYEDCAQLARQHHQPWQHIHRSALYTWQQGADCE